MNFIIKDFIRNKKILFVASLLIMFLPSIIIFVGINRYLVLQNEVCLSELKEKFSELTRNLNRHQKAETFIAKSLSDFTFQRSEASSFGLEYAALCQEMVNAWPNDFKAIIIDNSGNIIYKTKDIIVSDEDAKTALDIIFEKGYSVNNLNIIKNILGNQLTKKVFDYGISKNDYQFIYPDNNDNKDPFIISSFGGIKVCVWASKKLLNSHKHTDFICRKFANLNKINIGVYNLNNIQNTIHLYNLKNIDADIIKQLSSSKGNADSISTDYYWICRQYAGDNEFVFVFEDKKYSNAELMLIPLLFIVVYSLLLRPVIVYSYDKIILGVSKSLPVRIKVASVMLMIASISMFLLFYIGKEYEIHKKNCLIREAKEYSFNKLFEINSRYEAFLNDLAMRLDNALDIWAKGIKGRNLNVADIYGLNSTLSEFDLHGYYCVASQSAFWIENSGLYNYTGELDNIKVNNESSVVISPTEANDFRQSQFINLISKRICAEINEVALPANVTQRLDMFAETVTKTGFVEIIYSVVNNIKSIKPWAYAKKNCNALFKLISLNDELMCDYLFTAFWYKSNLIRSFIKNISPIANRNPNNFKFIFYNLENDSNTYNIDNVDLKDYAVKANSEDNDELKFITINKSIYLLSNIKSPLLSDVVIIGLYPIDAIEMQFKNKISILWVLFSLSLVLVLFSSCLISNYFINPLKKLENKAALVENKNYEPMALAFSNDEFGLLNKAFDEAIETMKELDLAQYVQEGMFPKPNFEQNEFQIYGKSKVMTIVGGDYFDIFPVKDNSFVALMGDVAGHGVGASVLMAMAKSAILTAKDKYQSPAAILNYLHKMVLATKTDKQRKTMTFQYLYMNSVDGNGMYGNAGGCFPCIVRNMGKNVEELKMGGSVLGGFKKAVYKEMPLCLDNGDALIFYSDGIVEAKNAAGQVLGYDALFELFKDAYHANPEKYYENIYARYLEHIKGLEPQDDMTIVIITRRSKKAKLWDKVELMDLA